MAKPKIQMLGLCRFSYPGDLQAFKHNFQTEADLRDHLYADDRINQRFCFFEHLSVPSLSVQTDTDFKLIVLAGDQMPDHQKSRLLEICSTVPQIEVQFHPEGQKPRDLCRDVMMASRDATADVIGEFRLDDDDAVATEFIERSRKVISANMPIFKEREMMCVDFCRGYVVAFSPDWGVRAVQVTERLWTPGQVICRNPVDPSSLLDMNHTRVWMHMPVVSVPNRPMFLRGAHSMNDSNLLKRVIKEGQGGRMRDQTAYRIKTRFNVQPPELKAAWRALTQQ